MILLKFTFNRETLNFTIKNKDIYYCDRIFKQLIRCLPPPENLIKTVALSRNKIPKYIIDLFTFTEAEMKEYNDAKGETELADIIIKDCKSKGCIFQSKEEIKTDGK